MRLVNTLRRRRFMGLPMLAVFALLLSACSPGAFTALNLHASGKNASDVLSVQVVCGEVPVSMGNCRGLVNGVIDGMKFYTIDQSGGTEDNTLDYSDCLQAPCLPGGAAEIVGNAEWGTQQIRYEIDGYDNGPGATDIVHVSSGTTSLLGRTFTCTGCVRVVVLPGHVPGS